MGTKLENLIKLKNSGFLVPDFFVADIKLIDAQRKALEIILKNAQNGNITQAYDEAAKIIKDTQIVLPKPLDIKKHYAVRSSAKLEDLPAHSFAGIYDTFLNVKHEDLKETITKCYLSMFSLKSLSYCIKNNIDLTKNEMTVIVQEMVNAGVSGVALSVNCLTGVDTEFFIEVTDGFGGVVEGQDNPTNYIYDWYKGKEISTNEKGAILTDKQKQILYRNLLDIQCIYGYPVDVEFAFCGDSLYVLQARPITKIFYKCIEDSYTTANFKDGGVAANACNMLLFSLYEKTFENSMREFYLKTKAFKNSEMNKLIIMRFARPYWNYTVTKGSLLKIPGFVERKYDEELGLKIAYKGDGRKSNIKLKNIPEVLKIMFACIKILKDNKKNALKILDYHSKIAKEYFDIDINNLTLLETETIFYKLIKNDYYAAEYDYFTQVFINILKIKMIKNKLKKYSDSEFLSVVSGIKSISHIRMHKAALTIANKIKADNSLMAYWQKDAQEIKTDFDNGTGHNGLDMVKEFIWDFRYHSERELDITYPNFDEDCIYAIKIIKKVTANEYDFSKNAQKKDKNKNVYELKRFLWIREELKDISTKFYYLIRKFTLRLAKLYKQNGYIKNETDIFHLRFQDIFDFIQNKNQKALQENLQKNKSYYDSFVNYEPDTEIGKHNGEVITKPVLHKTIKGIACSPVSYKGTARVILSLADLDELKNGEIIVARFADSACMARFSCLGGIVTETGGSMCHSSIVAREYGIAVVAGADGILKAVKTGDILHIDGEDGIISIIN